MDRIAMSRARYFILIGLATVGMALASACSSSASSSSSPTTTQTRSPGTSSPGTSSSGSSSTSSTTSTTSGGLSASIVFKGTISITGMDQVSGNFTDDKAGVTYSSCSAWAHGSNELGFGMPVPRAPVNGTTVNLILSLNYKGPGTYNQSSDLNLFNLAVGNDQFGDPSSFTVQVNPDGSGQATLTDLHSQTSMSTSANVSVTESWTCQ